MINHNFCLTLSFNLILILFQLSFPFDAKAKKIVLKNKITHYFHYENYNFRITDAEYSRFILPQMRNILIEIPYSVNELLKDQKKLIEISTSFYKLKIKYEQLGTSFFSSRGKKNIPTQDFEEINDLCKNSINIYQKNLDKKIMPFLLIQKHKIHIKNCLNLTNFILLIKFSKSTAPKFWIRAKRQFILNLSHLFLSSSELIKYSLKKEIRVDYDQFLIDFYYPLYRIYGQKIKSKTLFKNQIDNLNMSLNIFLMAIERKDEKFLPPEHIKKIKILLNRWNSILKVILRKK